MTSFKLIGIYTAVLTAAFLWLPEISFASVEGTLTAVQSKLVNVILPLASVLGLVYAGFSFVTGNPNARQHLLLAIIGATVGFGAQSLVAFIRGLVN